MSGIDRVKNAFSKDQPAFMPYAVMGYPSRQESLDVINTLVEAGADLLELGIPFSDPLADGPTIQAATQKSLENGTTLKDCLAMTRQLRDQGVNTPALMMGYINPMLAYGLDQLVVDAVAAGVDGFIIPDLPPEEAGEMEALCNAHNLALVFLLAPTSTAERIKTVAQKSKGFIYLVSLTGVTGARSGLSSGLSDFVARVREQTQTPLAVGFGIGDGQTARTVAQYADGVIVGSALVKRAAKSSKSVRSLAVELREALA